jgi:hypothetical protein
MAADLSQWRVQLRVQGQRFESSVKILETYCASFRTYFENLRQLGSIIREPALVPPFLLHVPGASGGGAAAEAVECSVALDGDRKLLLVNVAPPVAASDDSAVAGVTNSSSSKLKSLDPEFLGAILVYLRKLSAAKTASDARLTVVWSEMPHDQQRSFAAWVAALGVEPLEAMGYGAPTTPPGAPGASPTEDAMLHGGRALVDVAREYVAARCGAPPPHPSTTDDGLAMPAAGCFRCGMSGHDAHACPH